MDATDADLCQDANSGNRLSPWLGRCLLGVVLGAALASRPCYLPVLPLVLVMVDGLTAACAMSSFAVLAAGSLALGWTPEHLVVPWSRETAAAMFGLSLLGTVFCRGMDRWLVLAALLALPALWASNCAYHLVIAAPFAAVWASSPSCHLSAD